MVIGNKSDLESQREVELAEAESLCEYVPEVLYVIETSAKENKNIDDAFACLATELKVEPNRLQYWQFDNCMFIIVFFPRDGLIA